MELRRRAQGTAPCTQSQGRTPCGDRRDRAAERPERGRAPAGRTLAAGLAVLAAAFLLACAPGDGTGGEGAGSGAPASGGPGAAGGEGAVARSAADTAAPRYGIRLATDRAVYAPGDTIRMRLEVFRRGGRPLTLSFPTAQRHDFVLRGPEGSDPTTVRWRWSEDRFFAQAQGTVTLDGDRPTITATASRPAPSEPGLYRLEGRLSASDWPISAVVPLTVTP